MARVKMESGKWKIENYFKYFLFDKSTLKIIKGNNFPFSIINFPFITRNK